LKRLHNTLTLHIPSHLPVAFLKDALEVGHGYHWTTLLTDPQLCIHGNPPVGDLPEIVIVGKTILIEGSSECFARFRRMLQALAHQCELTGGDRVG
jgi:hypothetical protein